MNLLNRQIWLGDASDAGEMARRGATRLVDLRAEASPLHYGVPAVHFPIQDEREGQQAMLSQAARWVAEKARAGETVAIYCQAGNSRTAAVAGLALAYDGYSWSEAMQRVRAARPTAMPSQRLGQSAAEVATVWQDQRLTHLRISVDGMGLHVVHRPGSGPHLVLLHGVYGSWTHWAGLLYELSDGDLWFLDLPGYGESDDWPGSFEWSRYLDRLAKAIAGLGLQGAILGGYSFGAYLALLLLNRVPDLAKAGILVSLAGRVGDVSRDWRVEERRFPPDPLFDDRLAVVAENLRAIHFGEATHVSPQAVYTTYHNIWRTRLGPRRMRDSRSDRVNPLVALSGVEKPFLMIWGEKDPYCQPRVFDWQAACLDVNPRLDTHIIQGTAHWVQEEAAAAVAALIEDFVGVGLGRLGEGDHHGLWLFG